MTRVAQPAMRAGTASMMAAEGSGAVPAGTYNIVILGAGAGGLVTAAGSAGVGAKVAIIEKTIILLLILFNANILITKEFYSVAKVRI